MSSVLTNLSVIQKIAKDLVQPRQLNYSQQCIPYYIDETKFTIQNIQNFKNLSNYTLKCTLIRHRISEEILSTYKQQKRSRNQFSPDSIPNSKCVVFLHGLGSSRLEALPLVESLPATYCLFAFDLAGSGKSQGDNITYGLRQSEDIDTILQYLRSNKGIKQFIIWGRSMGAVATLLYSISLAQKSKESILAKSQLTRIKGLVIDSPFSDFKQITKQIGLKRVNIPQFLLDIALGVIENSFNDLLKDSKRGNKIYNPFSIKLGEQNIQTKIPTIFLYSVNDEVVPKEHSQKIIKVYKSLFDKFIMDDCSHNQSRPKDIIDKVFESLKKFQYRQNRMSLLDQQNNFRALSRNNSVEMNARNPKAGRRGISVQSKQKERSFIQNNYTEQSEHAGRKKISIQSYSSLKIQPRRDKLSCKISKNMYIDEEKGRSTAKQANQSPLKIKLSNKNYNQQGKTTSMGSHKTEPKISQVNFYSTIQYDNSILQRKLLKKDEQQPIYRTIENKNNLNYLKNRRANQMARKVEYQLNHTRYL